MTNCKTYVAYRMTSLPMTLSDPEGHFSYFKSFSVSYLKIISKNNFAHKSEVVNRTSRNQLTYFSRSRTLKSVNVGNGA